MVVCTGPVAVMLPAALPPPTTVVSPHHQHQATIIPENHSPPLTATTQHYTTIHTSPILTHHQGITYQMIPPPLPAMSGVATLPPSPTATIYPASVWGGQSYGMEAVWNNEFKLLFSYYYQGCYPQHIWYLCPTETKPSGRWNAYMDSAKVRFCCQECGHGWTSMKGRVVFWFYLNHACLEGFVTFKLYGQVCQKCKSERYENAMWYPEEVSKVMHNVFNRVGQVFYNFPKASYTSGVRAGKPRTPHRTDLCQACSDGICTEKR